MTIKITGTCPVTGEPSSERYFPFASKEAKEAFIGTTHYGVKDQPIDKDVGKTKNIVNIFPKGSKK